MGGEKAKNKKTAILIGTTEFPDAGLPSLPDSRENVLALQTVLTDPSIGWFHDAIPLIDLPHYELTRNIDQVFREAERDDQVLLYVCGYGYLDSKGLIHLLSINSGLTLLHSTALSNEFLGSVLRETRCRRISMVLDCVWTSADSTMLSGLDVSIRRGFESINANATEGSAFSVLATKERLLRGDGGNNGVSGGLSKNIIEVLTSSAADLNQDGYVSVNEVFSVLEEIDRPNHVQCPLYLQSGPTEDLIIARSTSGCVRQDLIRRVKKKLHEAHDDNSISAFIRDQALLILDMRKEEIESSHDSIFRILMNWTEGKISLEEFVDCWYQYEDTGLPETDISDHSTSIKERWKVVGKCREPIHDRVAPCYILDENFQFLDWNPMFDELIAKPLGLMRGRHVEDFILELENKQEVIRRARDTFEPGCYPIVDVEDLVLKTQFGLVYFKKIASQIFDDEGCILAWAVNLDILRAENETALWQALEARLLEEVNWSLYAKSYDRMLLKFDAYTALVKTLTDPLQDARCVLDLASGTGNVTKELLHNGPDREVWALEANEDMLEYMRAKIESLGNRMVARTNIIKGDLLLSLRELPSDTFDGAVMMNALYAIEDRSRCLREIHRVLKPGGVLTYSSSTQDTDIDRLFSAIRQNLQEKGLLQEMRTIVDNAYDRNRAMNENIVKDSHEQVAEYAVAAGFDVRKDDVVRGAYEGAVTIVKATKKVYLSEQPVLEISETPRPNIKVFISYAHEDQDWCQRVQDFINPLARNGRIEIWTDHGIQLGDKWRDKIRTGLDQSNVAILLVSTAFLNSEFITNNELPVLLHAAHSRDVVIIPIIIETCVYDHVVCKYPDPVTGPKSFNLADLQSAGSPTSTMDTLSKAQQNVVLSEIAKRILKLVDV